MMGKLYIVGNGFDLHHGIPSSYGAFGKYLAVHDSEIAELAQDYLGLEGDWSDFESRLADFDAHTLIDRAGDFLMPYGAKEWSDSYHHHYQFEIERVVDALSSKMRLEFTNWIRQLPIPSPATISSKLLPVDATAAFLNFNYTPSLQQLYAVPKDNILHIHGAAANTVSNLVLGHAWRPASKDSLNFGVDPEATDTRVLHGNKIIDEYFAATFKPTQLIINKHQAFFHSLAKVKEILVVGHSLSDVDMPYFEEVIRSIDVSTVNWKVSYYGDLAGAQQKFEKLLVPGDRVQFAQLSDF